MIKSERISSRLDNWGIFVSLLCFVHCATMPILFISSTYLSAELEGIHALELPLLLLAILIGTLAISKAYKSHQKVLPVVIMLFGFVLLLAGGFAANELQETIIRVTGSLAVMLGHTLNKRFQSRTANEN